MTTETLTLKERVEDWTAEHCLALEQNYLDYHKRMVIANFERYVSLALHTLSIRLSNV